MLEIDSATTANSGQYSCTANNGETDEDAILTQTITITIATGKTNYTAPFFRYYDYKLYTENTGPVTTPVTSAPPDGNTTTVSL